jgi:exodeoxyribonuclease VII small subunit
MVVDGLKPHSEHRLCHSASAKATADGPPISLRAESGFHLRPSVLNFAFAMSSKAKPPGSELNFEKAMSRLEAIVEQMETGKLPLEDLIVRYEEGMNLVKVCQERLTNAEQKIEIIARNSAGKVVVKDFEPAAEPSSDDKSGEKELKNDEVRLF